MKNDKINKFTIVNDEGKKVECDPLFTFDSNETKKSYIVYTDNTVDDIGNTKVYASTYDPEGKSLELLPIETDKEWDIIENMLASIQKKMQDDNQGEE